MIEEDSDDDFDGYVDENEMNDSDEDDEDIGLNISDIDGGDISLGSFTSCGSVENMNNKSPVEFFQLFITSSISEIVIKQTNLYAQQYTENNNIPSKSRIHEWKKTIFDLSEFKKFLAIIITMGLVSMPRLEDYWGTKWPFVSKNFSSILKRDRFSLILRFIHLNDSTKYTPKGQPGHDPLFKIRPFMEPLLEAFKQKYKLRREISLDESMIGFKGRLWFIQYMPKKPTKWGMKAYVLADSISGYTWGWKLYAGTLPNIIMGGESYM